MSQLLIINGRRIGIHEYGDNNGSPVFYLHGFPGSRLDGDLLHFTEQIKDEKIRIIGVDRAGIGLSDYVPSRTLLNSAADLEIIADKLNIRIFSVMGFSGGGPYALACAFSLPKRVRSVGFISGMGPFDYKESRNDNAMFFSKRSPAIRRLIAHLLYAVSKGSANSVALIMKNFLPPADRNYLSSDDNISKLALMFSENFRQGVDGFRKEAEIYKEPWGFKPSQIHTPVHLWHGTADRNVSVTSAKRLAAEMPNCKANYFEGEGHFSPAGKYLQKILYDLIACS